MKTIYKYITLLFVWGLALMQPIQAQELSKKIGDKPTLINASAALEVESTNKGVLIARVALTGVTDATTIANGNVESMVVFNTATATGITPGYYYWSNSKWNRMVNESDVAALVPNATTLFTGKVQLAGDLGGAGTTATAPKVGGLQGTPVSTTVPTTGQVLAYNGTTWTPAAPSAAIETDGVIGNEVTDVIAGKGLQRAGTGSDTDPYKVGLVNGTANGQIMKWNGTSWALATDAGIATEVDGDITNEIQALSIAGNTVTLSNGGGNITLPAEADGIVGNEVTNVTANMGLARSGAGTAASPYTVGMEPGTATGQVMQWNGTNWALSSAGSGTVTSVTGTAPIAVATGTSTPVISLNNLGVTNAHLAADAVSSDKILDGTIANADLANGVGGIYKGSGSLSGPTIVSHSGNTLAFVSNLTNGFSVDGSTFSVDALNNRVGIGTATPTQPLHISSSSAGAVRIADGTQGDGYIFKSDANGVGSWSNTASTLITEDLRFGVAGGPNNVTYGNADCIIDAFEVPAVSNVVTLTPGRYELSGAGALFNYTTGAPAGNTAATSIQLFFGPNSDFGASVMWPTATTSLVTTIFPLVNDAYFNMNISVTFNITTAGDYVMRFLPRVGCRQAYLNTGTTSANYKLTKIL